MRKLLALSILTSVIAACASGRADDPGSAAPARAATSAFLFAEPETAVLVEWTENDGDVIGNVSIAMSNVAGGNVDQTVTPISGFVTSAGDVGLEFGKGELAENLTGRVDGETLTLAGSFGLVDRNQFTFRSAESGDWFEALAAIQASVDAAIAAERAAAEAERAAAEAAVAELSDDELGDPYVDIDLENRRFEVEMVNLDSASAQAESAVWDVSYAANTEPMTSMQVSQVRAALTVVETASADARAALRRLESHYDELRAVLLDIALEPFTRRLAAARRAADRAETAAATAIQIHRHAAERVAN